MQQTADRDGFTDSKGAKLDYESGLLEAARCVMSQHETYFVKELLRTLSREDVLVWLVDPDTGEFAS